MYTRVIAFAVFYSIYYFFFFLYSKYFLSPDDPFQGKDSYIVVVEVVSRGKNKNIITSFLVQNDLPVISIRLLYASVVIQNTIMPVYDRNTVSFTIHVLVCVVRLFILFFFHLRFRNESNGEISSATASSFRSRARAHASERSAGEKGKFRFLRGGSDRFFFFSSRLYTYMYTRFRIVHIVSGDGEIVFTHRRNNVLYSFPTLYPYSGGKILFNLITIHIVCDCAYPFSFS